jgi:hypothetical protein
LSATDGLMRGGRPGPPWPPELGASDEDTEGHTQGL